MDSPIILVLMAFVPFFGFFLWLMMQRLKSCPDCREPLPVLQSPFTKTKRQWWEGGYVCPKCGCETDIDGRKVAFGTPPKSSSIVKGVVLVTLAAIPGVVLLSLLLRR
jgi:hypothetical protein